MQGMETRKMMCNNPYCNELGILLGFWTKFPLCYCKYHINAGKHFIRQVHRCRGELALTKAGMKILKKHIKENGGDLGNVIKI